MLENLVVETVVNHGFVLGTVGGEQTVDPDTLMALGFFGLALVLG